MSSPGYGGAVKAALPALDRSTPSGQDSGLLGSPRAPSLLTTHSAVKCDMREPSVLRVAPVPLYNTIMDLHRFVETLGAALEEEMKS